MPYKLLLSEEVTPAIRRMVLEQLNRARRELSSTQNMQAGVHKSRTCLKRVRSLVRLARPIIGEELFRSENKTYRDLARALARPREAGALLETVLKFEAREDLQNFSPLLEATKTLIIKDKLSIESELEIVSLAALVETLDASITRWKKMPLPSAGFDKLAHGFGQTYQRGRVSLKVALGEKDSFYLHEWRKDVQQTWRHMQILTLIWPDDIMPRIRLAQEISKLLGTEHDITELTAYMKIHRKKIFKHPGAKKHYRDFKEVTKIIRRDLCLHAAERGRRLYAYDAKSLSKAMTIYWRTSKAMQPMPSLVRDMAQIGDNANKAVERMREARKQSDGATMSVPAKEAAKNGHTPKKKMPSDKAPPFKKKISGDGMKDAKADLAGEDEDTDREAHKESGRTETAFKSEPDELNIPEHNPLEVKVVLPSKATPRLVQDAFLDNLQDQLEGKIMEFKPGGTNNASRKSDGKDKRPDGPVDENKT